MLWVGQTTFSNASLQCDILGWRPFWQRGNSLRFFFVLFDIFADMDHSLISSFVQCSLVFFGVFCWFLPGPSSMLSWHASGYATGHGPKRVGSQRDDPGDQVHLHRQGDCRRCRASRFQVGLAMEMSFMTQDVLSLPSAFGLSEVWEMNCWAMTVMKVPCYGTRSYRGFVCLVQAGRALFFWIGCQHVEKWSAMNGTWKNARSPPDKKTSCWILLISLNRCTCWMRPDKNLRKSQMGCLGCSASEVDKQIKSSRKNHSHGPRTCWVFGVVRPMLCCFTVFFWNTWPDFFRPANPESTTWRWSQTPQNGWYRLYRVIWAFQESLPRDAHRLMSNVQLQEMFCGFNGIFPCILWTCDILSMGFVSAIASTLESHE